MSNATLPIVGLIGGTGFSESLDEIYGPAAEQVSVQTPYGAAIVAVYQGGDDGRIAFIRRHGEGHSVPPHRVNHRRNLFALNQMGVRATIATAAVGSLNTRYSPGSIMVLDDFIDLRGGEPTTFFDGVGDVRHTDFTEPFSTQLRQSLIDELTKMAGDGTDSPPIHPRGTYLCLSGPRYETPAEVRVYGQWGADVVGMTAAAEAILAREINMEYACIAVVTNLGTGLSETALSHEDVGREMALSRPFLLVAVDRVLRQRLRQYAVII